VRSRRAADLDLERNGGARFAAATTTVGDFDGERLKLSHRKGRPPKLRSRYVVLDEDGIAFFKLQTKDKLLPTPLFTCDARKPWRAILCICLDQRLS